MIIMCDSYVRMISSQRNEIESGQCRGGLEIGEDSLELQGVACTVS